MQRIVQLYNHEYNGLVKDAKLNLKEIDKRAEAIYKEKGISKIVLNMSVHDDDYESEISIQSKGRDNGYNTYELSLKEKRKIIDFMQYKSEQIFMRKYGKHLEALQNIQQIGKKNRQLGQAFKIVTILGWAVAITLIVIHGLN